MFEHLMILFFYPTFFSQFHFNLGTNNLKFLVADSVLRYVNYLLPTDNKVIFKGKQDLILM